MIIGLRNSCKNNASTCHDYNFFYSAENILDGYNTMSQIYLRLWKLIEKAEYLPHNLIIEESSHDKNVKYHQLLGHKCMNTIILKVNSVPVDHNK